MSRRKARWPVTSPLGWAVRAVSGVLVAVLVAIVRVYQITLSPFFGAQCRFFPSCSEYAIEALQTRGAVRGLGLAVWRILRCNPYGGHGYDPVPPPKKESADCADDADKRRRDR
jgi:uncharacterized protein